jgi:hypothetical protein
MVEPKRFPTEVAHETASAIHPFRGEASRPRHDRRQHVREEHQ